MVKVRISIEFECFLKQKNLFKILKIVVVQEEFVEISHRVVKLVEP